MQIEVRKVNKKKKNGGVESKAVEFIAKENTWSNQRRKRREEKRRTSLENDDQPELKKSKIDTEVTNEQKAQTFYLKGLLLLEETDSETITLHMQWIEGGLGRESINQILQYMKNHLFDK